MSRQRVVITGMGCVTGFGIDWDATWDAMCAGRHCIREWRPQGLAPDEDFPVRYAAPVDPDALPTEPNRALPLEYRSRLGLLAARLAWEDSGLAPHARRGAAVFSASGAPHHRLSDMQLALGDDGQGCWTRLWQARARAHPEGSLRQSNDRLAQLIAAEAGCAGPAANVSAACAGAAQAVGNAFRMIRRGERDCALAGGADSVLNLETMSALHVLGAPSTETRFGQALCRPFDAARSGLVAGEGAGYLVLESLPHARARGARIIAELVGYGSSLDGYKLTAPDPQGRGAAAAMQAALADARIAPGSIDLVNAHGTSTRLNDVSETRAIRSVFADDGHAQRLSITANKSQFGHLIAAAAAPELIATALSCRDDIVPPTLHLDQPDPECNLDYTPGQARARRVEFALSNSFGFGGLNACLVLRKHRAEAHA